ncbi:hypothetical protein DPMN_109982 [Dreissena polymorpha]|uniref:Uncharacterized protein n=1 Tax=Dreissena polymorpha TaxID=45954 RepID=A0A9D4QMI3_DREPO|nr:hypothetical protein DPMN_109982 [Dreissena polymorpha]
MKVSQDSGETFMGFGSQADGAKSGIQEAQRFRREGDIFVDCKHPWWIVLKFSTTSAH